MAFIHISKIIEFRRNPLKALKYGEKPCLFCTKNTNTCGYCKYHKEIMGNIQKEQKQYEEQEEREEIDEIYDPASFEAQNE